jgi:hypothetical protein
LGTLENCVSRQILPQSAPTQFHAAARRPCEGFAMPKVPPRRKPMKKKAAAAAKQGYANAERADVVRRLWIAAEAQVRQLEERLAASLEPADREREARAMAVLVKTLRDLNELDAARDKRAAQNDDNAGATADMNHDDPRQIDDFRRELARRIEAIKSGATTDAAGGS